MVSLNITPKFKNVNNFLDILDKLDYTIRKESSGAHYI